MARISIVLAAIMAMVLGASASAFASGTWSNERWSPCDKNWTYNPYGGQALVHDIYSADTSNQSQYVESNGTAWVDNLQECGPSGSGIYASHIDLKITFTLYGVGLNCSVSMGGASCSASYTNVSYTYDRSCASDVYSCVARFGSLYFKAPAGGKFNKGMTMQTTAVLYRADGYSLTFSTIPV